MISAGERNRHRPADQDADSSTNPQSKCIMMDSATQAHRGAGAEAGKSHITFPTLPLEVRQHMFYDVFDEKPSQAPSRSSEQVEDIHGVGEPFRHDIITRLTHNDLVSRTFLRDIAQPLQDLSQKVHKQAPVLDEELTKIAGFLDPLG